MDHAFFEGLLRNVFNRFLVKKKWTNACQGFKEDPIWQVVGTADA
jgi:hypothetical protein